MSNFKRMLALCISVCLILTLFAGCKSEEVVWESYNDVSYVTVPNSDVETNSTESSIDNGTESTGSTNDNGTTSNGATTNNGTASNGATTNSSTTSNGVSTNKGTASNGATTNNSTASNGATTNNGTASNGASTNNGTTSNGATTNNGTTSNAPTTNNGTTSNAPTTNNGTTSNAPTTNNGTTSNAPTTNNGNTSNAPTTNNGTTSNAPTTNNGTTSNAPTTNNGTTSNAPTINNGTTSNAPTTNNGTTSNAPTTNNGNTSNAPTTNNGNTSNAPTTNNGTTSNAPTTNSPAGRFDNLNYSGKTIKLLVWYTPQSWEQQIYDEFAEMTGAKIRLIQQGTSDNKLAALIAANDAPDAYMMRQENFPHYITKKLVQPLTGFIDKEKDTWLAYDLMDHIKYNDEYYGITDHIWGDTYYVYFNEDLFEKNLDVKKNPLELYNEGKWTWDAFYDLASKMTIKNPQGNITQYGSTTSALNLFALSAGANVVSFSNGKFINTLNSNEMKAAAAMEKKLAAGGYYTDTAGDFTQGNVAMYVYPQYRIREKGSWADLSFDWDFVPFPTYTGGTHYNPAAYEYGVVPNKAKNPEAGFMLLNYRSYCQENMKTLSEPSPEWKERFQKTAKGKTKASLDIGVCGQIWGLYRELSAPNSNVQTVIDSWLPKIDGKIRDFEAEQDAYK